MKFINSENLQDALSAFRAKTDATYSKSGHTHNYAGSSSAGGAATSANKVNSNMVVKLNGGTTEGTNLFTFNGSAAKTINITPSSIGAAASSHGTHVTYSTTAPKVAGTAAVGSETSVARGDHVHAAQTTVSGNAGSATKLATARNITIGNKVNSFNGTAAITYTVDDIGAVKGQFKTATTAATAQWYRVAQSEAGISRVAGVFFIESTVSGKHSVTTLSVGVNYGVNPYVQQLSHSAYSTTGISKARIVYHTTYNSNYAYLEVYQAAATAATMNVRLIEGMGWTLVAPNTVGSIPSGYTNKEITLANNTIVSNLSGTASNASKVANSLKIQLNGGTTENTNQFTFNGSGAKTINITPSAIGAAAESHGTHLTIGTGASNAAAGNHTHNYAGSSSAGGAATSANKVNANLVVKLNSGSTEGTNLFTFNGSAAKTINITPSGIGAAASSHGNHVPATETANNAKFLRNDNTWATVTPANIGAAASSHGTHLTLGTGSGNAYRGDYGNTAYTHSQAAHAPSNAQKNSDITKAEIEAKLTGTITSHNHTNIQQESLSGLTVSLNDYNLSAGTIHIKYYYCPTDGGGSGITGRPNDNSKQAFNLKVELIRWASATDYITKQTYLQGSQKIMYVRYCTNGTWTSWEKVYTSGQKPTTSDIGAAPTSHASTATTYGAASASNYGHAMASSTSPKANGTAAVGSETAKFARGDHVHPLQTTINGFDFWAGTQEEYDAIATKSATTIYMITE